MKHLHLIANEKGFELMQAVCEKRSEDFVLFIGDGVLNLLGNQFVSFEVESIYALKSDLDCRGLNLDSNAKVNVIDDQQMVDLCANAQKVVSW